MASCANTPVNSGSAITVNLPDGGNLASSISIVFLHFSTAISSGLVKGNFQFNAQEAYMIENGKVTRLLKNFSLSGETLETLKNIDALSKEMQIGDPGFCGKGQLVPVGDGGPFTRIKNVIVGGM